MTNPLITKLSLLLEEAKRASKSSEVVELELAIKQATNMVHALKGVVADVEHCEICLCGIWENDPELGEMLDNMKNQCANALK
ncbi:hypothetical protein J7384_17205 [Endozoicomonas sp. G2_1]|uniref:hypothetical protein n=1 Tax=Endozoicomonas sp. G2_1 TaxID=2821091 RepID=UPI001ADC898B|nr:hypothetical protein [Endozoicomonas sp. G2_1]MBO9492103.1 hypothetical protein [Endozoicomonas sp. G2_1]